MLTVTGQNQDISQGLQIGKDQKGDNQRDENGHQFIYLFQQRWVHPRYLNLC